MVAHKAAFDADEVERLVILVVVIFGAEVFIPVAGHILLEESYKVFEKFEAILSQFIAELATGDDEFSVIFRCRNSRKYCLILRLSRFLRLWSRGGRWLRGCLGRRGRSGVRRRVRRVHGGGKCVHR